MKIKKKKTTKRYRRKLIRCFLWYQYLPPNIQYLRDIHHKGAVRELKIKNNKGLLIYPSFMFSFSFFFSFLPFFFFLYIYLFLFSSFFLFFLSCLCTIKIRYCDSRNSCSNRVQQHSNYRRVVCIISIKI